MHDGITPVGPRCGLRWFGAGVAGLAGFFALEALVRRPGEASDLHAGDEDAGSTSHIARASARSPCWARRSSVASRSVPSPAGAPRSGSSSWPPG